MITFKDYHKFTLLEGGYASTLTQSTTITPKVIALVKPKIEKFISEYNQYAKDNGFPPIKFGAFLGSTAHYQADQEDPNTQNNTYGDIDIQIEVPPFEETSLKNQSQWYKVFHKFVQEFSPTDVSPESPEGHPIINIGNDQWVQVDLLVHPSNLVEWGRYRATPERGLKGLLYGNLFAVLGDCLNMSIQYNGVQFKVKDGKKQPFASTRGNFELHTITTNIQTFLLDIFKVMAKDILGTSETPIDPLLKNNPGANVAEVKAEHLLNGIKGLVRSFEINHMFGIGDLAEYETPRVFLERFWTIYSKKVEDTLNGPKWAKASPEKVAQAHAKIRGDLEKVKKIFDTP
jgi:hypothetical protein